MCLLTVPPIHLEHAGLGIASMCRLRGRRTGVDGLLEGGVVRHQPSVLLYQLRRRRAHEHQHVREARELQHPRAGGREPGRVGTSHLTQLRMLWEGCAACRCQQDIYIYLSSDG